MSEVKIRIRIKRGTAGQWSAENPILGLGEIGWITDTGRWFCGDGVKTWNQIFQVGADRNEIWVSEKLMQDAIGYVESSLLTMIGQEITDRINEDANIYNYINSLSFVQSVNDIAGDIVSVDNTDPLNPIVKGKISVDGTTITGNGTTASPLTATLPTGFVESVSDDGGGIVQVDNIDPVNPVISFKGVAVDGVTIGGDGTLGNPLYSFGADTYMVMASASDSSPDYLQNKIFASDGSILVDNSVPTAVQLEVFQSPRVVLEGKNTSGGNIDAGDPVYIMGTVGATHIVEVGKADASDPNKMPAVGISMQSVPNNGSIGIIVSGFFENITTDPIDGITPSVGKTLYVKAGGGLTTTKPTGTNLIQNVGKVGKVSGGNSGSIIVSNIQRTNDIPNIADTKIWIGNASGVPQAQSLSGDVTMSNSGVVTIQNDAVTYAKMQNVSVDKRLLGRVSAGAGNVEEIELSADGTLGGAGASGSVVSSQAAVKNYVDTGLSAKQDTSAKNTANGYAGLDASTKLTGSQIPYGTTSNTACQGNDSRLSDARTPTAHASSHTNGTDDIQNANASQKGLLSSADWSTFNNKQDALVSGTNIKTINGSTILGSGDLDTAYTLFVQALTSAPADGATIYFGTLPKAPVTTANISKVRIPRDGIIKQCRIHSYSGTAGSNENWSMYIRKNNTTDTLVQTLALNTNEREWSNTSLNISVVAGDYIEIKLINPTWATNPNTTIFGGHIYIE